jgi:predicted  nucleic acid-binding Zn ribbon protein
VEELGKSIKGRIEEKLKVKCYLYINKNLTNSLEKELQEIKEFI